MLPKAKRLTKEDFNGTRPKVFFRHELLDIAQIPHISQKFACVVSKKTCKRAVDRNIIKRRVYTVLQSIIIQQKNSFILYPKRISLTTPYSHLDKEIKKAFATLH